MSCGLGMGVSRVWVRELRRALTWQQLQPCPIRFSRWPASATSRNGHSFLRCSRKPSSARPFPAPGAACSSRLSGSTQASVLELPAPGEAGVALPPVSLSPDPGPILPFRWQSSPRLLPPCPPHHPSAPRALPCPAPTAARKDAARVPCQRCECAAPPSRARNAAGPRGRPQTHGSGQAQHGAQAGRWPWLARTRIASRRKASCLPLNLQPSLH